MKRYLNEYNVRNEEFLFNGRLHICIVDCSLSYFWIALGKLSVLSCKREIERDREKGYFYIYFASSCSVGLNAVLRNEEGKRAIIYCYIIEDVFDLEWTTTSSLLICCLNMGHYLLHKLLNLSSTLDCIISQRWSYKNILNYTHERKFWWGGSLHMPLWL